MEDKRNIDLSIKELYDSIRIKDEGVSQYDKSFMDEEILNNLLRTDISGFKSFQSDSLANKVNHAKQVISDGMENLVNSNKIAMGCTTKGQRDFILKHIYTNIFNRGDIFGS